MYHQYLQRGKVEKTGSEEAMDNIFRRINQVHSQQGNYPKTYVVLASEGYDSSELKPALLRYFLLKTNLSSARRRTGVFVLLSCVSLLSTALLPSAIFTSNPYKATVRALVPSVEYYVSPTGSDMNPGTLAEPFRTLQKAKSVLAAGNITGAVVYFRGGTYTLTSQTYLDPSISGTSEAPNIFRNYPGENPIFTAAISTTVPAAGGDVTLDLTALQITAPVQSVYRDGVRLTVARTPNRIPNPDFSATDPWSGSLAYASAATPTNVATDCPGMTGNSLNYCEVGYESGSAVGQLDDSPDFSAHLAQTRAVVFTGGASDGTVWTSNSLGITEIDKVNTKIRLSQKTSYQVRQRHFFYLEGAPEFLDTEGEWAQDGTSLLLKLPASDTQQKITIVAYSPGSGTDVVSNSIVVTGSHIQIVGLQFHYAGESYAVRVQDASNIVMNNIQVKGCDAVCVLVAGTSQNVTIKNSRVSDTLGVGIHVTVEPVDTPDPAKRFLKKLVSAQINISNNYIWDVGIAGMGRYWASAGILAARTGTTISRNRIENTASAGISAGAGAYTIVDSNYVYRTNLMRADTGAIAFNPIWQNNDRSWLPRGHQITHNFIKETGGYSWSSADNAYKYGHYSWGVYLDDWTSETQVANNIIVRPHIDCVMVHGGRYNSITNNICYTDKKLTAMVRLREDHHSNYDGSQDPKWTEVQQMGSNGFDTTAYLTAFPDLANVPQYPAKGELQVHNTVSSNVLVSTHTVPPLLYGVVRLSATNTFSNNVLWSTNSSSLAVGGSLDTTPDNQSESWPNLTSWQQTGRDAGSVFANPLLANPAADDFSLGAGSPAFAKGFTAINQSTIGLFGLEPQAQNVSAQATVTQGENISATWTTLDTQELGPVSKEVSLFQNNVNGSPVVAWSQVASDSMQYSSTGLEAGSTYFVCVRAKNDGIDPFNGQRAAWSAKSCSSAISIVAPTTPTATPTTSSTSNPTPSASLQATTSPAAKPSKKPGQTSQPVATASSTTQQSEATPTASPEPSPSLSPSPIVGSTQVSPSISPSADEEVVTVQTTDQSAEQRQRVLRYLLTTVSGVLLFFLARAVAGWVKASQQLKLLYH